jgi:hypothetical protein
MSIIERMRGFLTNRLIVLSFFPVLASPVFAQKVATKDGTVIQLQKYRLTEEALFYVNDAGREVAIRMHDIELDRTALLNAHEASPLVLPGMTPAMDKATTQQSLGDIARKTRSGQKNGPKKHAFTDDDVAHGSDVDQNAQQKHPVDVQGSMDAAQKIVGQWSDKTPRELSNEVAGQIQFPGRDSWEQRIYEQKTKMVSAAQTCLDDAKRLVSAPTPEEKKAAQTASDLLLRGFNIEKNNFDQLVAEGVKKAGEWERLRR